MDEIFTRETREWFSKIMKILHGDAKAVLRINTLNGVCQLAVEGSAGELIHILESSRTDGLIEKLKKQAQSEISDELISEKKKELL